MVNECNVGGESIQIKNNVEITVYDHLFARVRRWPLLNIESYLSNQIMDREINAVNNALNCKFWIQRQRSNMNLCKGQSKITPVVFKKNRVNILTELAGAFLAGNVSRFWSNAWIMDFHFLSLSHLFSGKLAYWTILWFSRHFSPLSHFLDHLQIHSQWGSSPLKSKRAPWLKILYIDCMFKAIGGIRL